MAPLWKVGLHVVCSCLWLWMLGISMELLGIPNVWRKMSSSHPLKIRDKWSKIKIPTVLGHFHFDSYFRIGFFTTTEVLFHASFWGKVCCEKWTTEPTCKHCGTRTATTPENSGVFSTGVPCDSTDIFCGAYKVFETILAFALLKVALLICCAYLFFLSEGHFIRTSTDCLFFELYILNTYHEIRIVNICCPQPIQMKHFHIKQMLWPYVPFIFSTHLVAFKKPPGFNALFFGVIEDGQFGCSAAVWFDWWQWCAGRGAHGSEESHKQWAVDLLLMVQKSVVHQLAGSLSHYLQRSIHPRWLLGISEPSTVGHLLYTRDSPFTQGLFHKTWKKGPFTNQSQIWWNVTS